MHLKSLRSAWFCAVTIITLVAAPIAEACYKAVNVPTPAMNCDCSMSSAGPECPPYSCGAFYNQELVPAGPGDAGYTSIGTQLEAVGVRYPCVNDLDGVALALCAVGIVGCTIACAGAVTGVGLALCLACLFGSSASCAWCSVVTCTVDSLSPEDIYAWREFNQSGRCTGGGDG